VADVSRLPTIRKRHKLTVMDAVRVQYHLGPGFNASYLHYYGGLIMATDPVAADAVGLAVVEHLRAANGLPSLAESGRPARYLQTAEEQGLGTADLSRLDLLVLRVDESGRLAPGELLP
jgi:hypothetical protein